MLLIGLTGSIATGKSTASRILSSPPHNLPIIDADAIARLVVCPGTPALARIVAHFAPTVPDILNPDGTLNRPALARRAFANEQDRAVVNGIMHPAVRREMYKQILHYYIRGHWAVILDIPLLFETHLDLFCGAVLVVSLSSGEVQLQRLLAREHAAGRFITREEAEQRVGVQIPLHEKVSLCERVYGGARGRGEVVWNDGGLEALEGELARVVARWAERRAGWWRLLWGFPPVAGVCAAAIVARNWWARRRRDGEEVRERAKL